MSKSVVVMGPLKVDDIEEFRENLGKLPKNVTAISTDVWWGLVEPTQGWYQWNLYLAIVEEIIKAGFKWVPILSFHQCGGNVNDTVTIPIPEWAWGLGGGETLNYVSQYGNYSGDCLSCWSTICFPAVQNAYFNYMCSFVDTFADYLRREDILEVNISLGPSGELRYPSYYEEGHDFPNRGSMQCYSRLAIQCFRDYAAKHGKKAIKELQGRIDEFTVEKLYPPSNPRDFFDKKHHLTMEYGKLLFDFYQDSLVKHAAIILTFAFKAFAKYKVDIGIKIPGIHWRIGPGNPAKHINTIPRINLEYDRTAELAAGLLRTSEIEAWCEPECGHGYISLLARLRKKLESGDFDLNRLVLHFTCLEMSNGDNWQPKSLVFWFEKAACELGLRVKGENALPTFLAEDFWGNLLDALECAAYEGVTLLRIDNIIYKTDIINSLDQFIMCL